MTGLGTSSVSVVSSVDDAASDKPHRPQPLSALTVLTLVSKPGGRLAPPAHSRSPKPLLQRQGLKVCINGRPGHKDQPRQSGLGACAPHHCMIPPYSRRGLRGHFERLIWGVRGPEHGTEG